MQISFLIKIDFVISNSHYAYNSLEQEDGSTVRYLTTRVTIRR